VALQMLFYASPVIYVTSALPDNLEQKAMASPLTAVLTQMRHALIDPAAPTAADAIGGEVRLLIPLALVVAVFAAGLWVFMREAPRIAENL
jgi:ABC-2 type transport system permease protein